jgi:hypothetical protein
MKPGGWDGRKFGAAMSSNREALEARGLLRERQRCCRSLSPDLCRDNRQRCDSSAGATRQAYFTRRISIHRDEYHPALADGHQAIMMRGLG